ncbi:glycosyltransferase family 2 protein [candidate division KSB1 bacterium]|nr:glycosyltransferase family 2 protein [candidate division KSB1 bacterium]
MELSIVIPLLNEKESLTELYERIRAIVQQLQKTYEIIFIDDGSSDGSDKVLLDLHKQDKNVKIIQFRKNYGKSAALAEGFARVQGEYVITMDADLQDDPQEIPRLIQKLDEGYDLVSGWKKKRYDPLSKRVPSKFFNWFVSKVAGLRLHDFNCGLKIYRKEVVKTLKLYGQLHRFIPMLAHWQGFRVSEIPVQHHPRKYGESKFGVSRFTSGLFDLITIIFLSKFKKRPLHLFGVAGLIAFLSGMAISLYLTIERIFTRSYLSNRPILFLGILLIIVGIQFVSIGLLGEMITETQTESNGLSIRKMTGFDPS